jgi:hypothetical protein
MVSLALPRNGRFQFCLEQGVVVGRAVVGDAVGATALHDDHRHLATAVHGAAGEVTAAPRRRIHRRGGEVRRVAAAGRVVRAEGLLVREAALVPGDEDRRSACAVSSELEPQLVPLVAAT